MEAVSPALAPSAAPVAHRAALEASVEDLLAAARSGSSGSLGKLFEMLRARLTDLAAKELPWELRAKLGPSDVVQETALDMHRNFARFRGTTAEECFAWIRAMLRNNVVDAVRRFEQSQKRDVARERSLDGQACGNAALIDASRPPDGSAIRHEDAAAVSAALARMPTDQRRVIELRYWHGLSFVEIGAEMGRSADAARKLWYRALEGLQEELAPAGRATSVARTRPAHKPR